MLKLLVLGPHFENPASLSEGEAEGIEEDEEQKEEVGWSHAMQDLPPWVVGVCYSYRCKGGAPEEQEKTLGVRGSPDSTGPESSLPRLCAVSASSPQGPQVPSCVKGSHPPAAHLLKGQVCLVGRWP